jgi:adenine-specific DNA-methyltransferase
MTMSQNLEKLKRLLTEVFQLDQAELDFGIYRIMNAKREEIVRFLDRDLLPQVREAFQAYEAENRGAVEVELAEAVEKAKELGADPETLPRVKELRAKLAQAVDVTALENEVYSHLYNFFRRYYQEGDFISLRRYKEGVYAIPYEGEEVKLHWANHDQYYIKTSEYLRDYTFKLPSGKRVHFKLAEADTDKDNNRAANGNERRFILSQEQTLAEENGELVVRFDYRPHPDKTKQADLNAAAVDRILNQTTGFDEWRRELASLRPTEKNANRTLLEKHLIDYTARNTFDYFIHKDLGGFLRRELDFYIKNEVMHLDDVESETAARVEQYLSKIKAIRRIAHKLIDFLAQIENFQKKLWLKKKFVVETQYCITLDRIFAIEDEKTRTWLVDQILKNDAQREEWVRLCAIDEIKGDLAMPGYSEPLKPEFLKAHRTLVVDTRHLPADFTVRLLAAIPDLDVTTDGLLIASDNFHALSLLLARYKQQVKCVYIDPPYNSKTTEIAYKNTYKHSSWIALMEGRLGISKWLSTSDGSHVVAIDENEQEALGHLLSLVFPNHEKVCVAVVHNKKGIQGDYFSYNHDYAFFCIPPALPETHGTPVPEAEWEFDNLRKWGRESERETARNCFYPIVVEGSTIVGFGDVCDEGFHPGAANVRDGARILVYPVDSQGIERKWRYARDSVEGILPLLKVHVVGSTGEIQIHKAKAEKAIKTVWDDSRYIAGDYGTKWLTDLGLKISQNLYPKSVHTVEDSIFAVADDDSWILDYFAGSGTTGHAVINLNREDGGRRKFILVEMGDYFDTVLLPRIKKVTFTPEWKDGKPRRPATQEEVERSPRVIKVLRLESYEDTLNNLQLKRTGPQQTLLEQQTEFREDYVLRYMLDVEARESPSLLNIECFEDPFNYTLNIATGTAGETKPTVVDLVETFNYLIGLRVKTIDDVRGVRVVTGLNPQGERVLILWRKTKELDNDALDAWFRKQGYNTKDQEYDVIYVNGDNNLENLRKPDQTWKVRLTEEEFRRLMFDVQDV